MALSMPNKCDCESCGPMMEHEAFANEVIEKARNNDNLWKTFAMIAVLLTFLFCPSILQSNSTLRLYTVFYFFHVFVVVLFFLCRSIKLKCVSKTYPSLRLIKNSNISYWKHIFFASTFFWSIFFFYFNFFPFLLLFLLLSENFVFVQLAFINRYFITISLIHMFNFYADLHTSSLFWSSLLWNRI